MIEISQPPPPAPRRPEIRAVPAAGTAPPPVLAAEKVSKTYKNGVRAVHRVDLEVRQGEVLCLLGPNGAGKTTLTRILATQLSPSEGTARVCGYDVTRQTKEVRRLLAVVPQQCFPDYQLKVWEHVFYYLAARGMSWRQARKATREIVERLGLAAKFGDLISDLSGGMRRRVLLAMALAAGAPVLLLDEPTAGLDVLLRRELWQSLTATRHERTVLLTTHSMEEAEALADRIGIMGEGELVACGTVAELRALAPGEQKVVVDEGALPRAELERFGYLQEYAGKWAVFPPDTEAVRRLMQVAVEAEVEASLLHTSLEDVFVYLVGDRRGKLKLGELR